MPTPATALDHPTAVFLGDSISTGWSGTSAPRNRWTSRVADALGWRETTLAIDGMGWYRRRGADVSVAEGHAEATDSTLVEAAVRLRPDVVLVCLSVNDVLLLDERGEAVRAGIRRDLALLAAGLPDVPVLVAPYFPGAELPGRAARLEGWVREETAAAGLRYVDALWHALDEDPALLCDDLIHPNDAGHAALAEAILPALRDLALPARV